MPEQQPCKDQAGGLGGHRPFRASEEQAGLAHPALPLQVTQATLQRQHALGHVHPVICPQAIAVKAWGGGLVLGGGVGAVPVLLEVAPRPLHGEVAEHAGALLLRAEAEARAVGAAEGAAETVFLGVWGMVWVWVLSVGCLGLLGHDSNDDER